MENQDISSESTVIRDEEDIFKIMVATDIHLGYLEDDPVRGSDTFDSLEEILQLAVKHETDFVLLGGDLFHNAQPSPYCIQKCLELLKKYCLGDRPVSIEFLSDPSQNFSKSQKVNYEDPNLNISLPVFSIHGNHDDPTGKKHVSALDLLSTSGLVNYFGRWDSFDKVEISPILLQKGKTKLALYGLSHIRDERLGRLFLENKVKMLSPKDKEDWFHLLVLHQNRATRGTKNFIPDSCLPEFLNLVIWGHEHDCRIQPEEQLAKVFISQPGSSVATSLIEGESITKHVGLLKIHECNFKMEPEELKTVRPFKYAEITLSDEAQKDDDDDNSAAQQSMQVIRAKVEEMITEAKTLHRTKKVSAKPLIRLIVKYKNEKSVFNAIRFGQEYADKVANPDNIVKFQLIKPCIARSKLQNKNLKDEEMIEGPVLADRVEDLVCQYFTENKHLEFFPLNTINEAVKRFIDANDATAISDVTESLIKEMLKKLEEDLPEIEDTEKAIDAIKSSMEANSLNLVNKILEDPKRTKKPVEINSEDEDDNSDTEVQKSTKSSKRGRGGTKAPKGRGARSSRVDDDDCVQILDDSDDNSVTKRPHGIFGSKAANTSRGGRAPSRPRGSGTRAKKT